MTKPVLSVVVPNYNGAQYLEELLLQLRDIKGRERLEVLVMDGASSDSSLEVAKALTYDHDIINSQKDDGQADAIAKGLELARGRWFMFQNSDDLFNIPVLEGFLENFDRFGGGNVVAFDQAVSVLENENWRTYLAFAHTRPITFQQLSVNIYFTNQSTVYLTKEAKLIGFDKSKQFAMDYDFVVRFFRTMRPKVVMVDKVLGTQRMHPDTKTSNMGDVCARETAEIRNREFSVVDRGIGVLRAASYHFDKKLRAMRDPRLQKPDLPQTVFERRFTTKVNELATVSVREPKGHISDGSCTRI